MTYDSPNDPDRRYQARPYVQDYQDTMPVLEDGLILMDWTGSQPTQDMVYPPISVIPNTFHSFVQPAQTIHPQPAATPSSSFVQQPAVASVPVPVPVPASVPEPVLDTSKPSHPEWGVLKDQEFHPLTLKHQRDLENLYQTGASIIDFHFWQANLGGYCMANMVQKTVVSPDGCCALVRRVVEGAPHPGRKNKKRGMG